MTNFVSYAQNFEDVMLWRALGHVPGGFYVDIGAQHPLVDSVSRGFYDRGWRGIHVEPTQFFADLIRADRPDEAVMQAAIGPAAGTLTFFEIAGTGISTGDPEIARQHQGRGFEVHETSVACITLAELFKTCEQRPIHWLKIDVEGMEKQVLESWAPSDARPWMVVIESVLPLTQIESHAEWEPILLEKGYQFVWFDGLNRFYVLRDQEDLLTAFRSGPNIFDNFTLSGTANAPFTHRLKTKLAQVEADLQQKLIAAETQAARISDALANAEAHSNGLSQALEGSHLVAESLRQELQSSREEGADLRQKLASSREELAKRDQELGAIKVGWAYRLQQFFSRLLHRRV